jgi:exodeoxyribonuclease VII large subunit
MSRSALSSDTVVSVGQLTREIKDLLERGLDERWVRGEVSNLRQQTSGHLYFTLKDQASQLPVALFRGDALRLSQPLRDGQQVVVFGKIQVYEPRGAYQLIARHVMPDGQGDLQARFEALKQRLQAEGLFAPERKKPLPALPRRIGFVTSPTGAAIRDFISILRRREWTGQVIIIPARVQGREAIEDLVKGIGQASRLEGLELLVIGRGGGSLEDLWCFNEEAVVRAVVACPVPTIAAVGHEIDFSLCDFAADWRAETPSAAAEWISSRYLAARDGVDALRDGLVRALRDGLDTRRADMRLLSEQLRRLSPVHHLERAFQQVDDLAGALQRAPRERLQQCRHQLAQVAARLANRSPEQRLTLARTRLQSLETRLQRARDARLQQDRMRLSQLAKRLDNTGMPQALRRGFVVVRDAEGHLVTAREGLRPGQSLVNTFHDGEVTVTVQSLPTGRTP